MKKLLVLLIAAAMMAVSVTACGPSESTTTTKTDSELSSSNETAGDASEEAPAEDAEAAEDTEAAEQEQAEIKNQEAAAPADAEVTDRRDFVITLYPEYAPVSCENFEKLVSDGFYNGLGFHRVMEGFMAQGGDPSGDGTGGSKETIKGEFIANGVDNKLSHKRGIVSMARSMDYDSASSQFFICYSDDDTFLDGQYAAFGEVTDGMEVVDAFLAVPRSMSMSGELSVPESPIKIKEAVMAEPDENGNPRVKITMEDFIK